MRIAVVAPSSPLQRPRRPSAVPAIAAARASRASSSSSTRNASSATIISPAPTPTRADALRRGRQRSRRSTRSGSRAAATARAGSPRRRSPARRRRRATRPSSAIATPAILLAGLYRAGFPQRRARADAAGRRARRRRGGGRARAGLADRRDRREALEPGLERGRRHAAFNITVLSQLLGTPLEPDLAGHVLLLEEVSRAYLPRPTGRCSTSPASRRSARVAGIRLGRCQRRPAQRSRLRRERGGGGPLLVRARRHPLSRPRRHRPRFGQQGGAVRPALSALCTAQSTEKPAQGAEIDRISASQPHCQGGGIALYRAPANSQGGKIWHKVGRAVCSVR